MYEDHNCIIISYNAPLLNQFVYVIYIKIIVYNIQKTFDFCDCYHIVLQAHYTRVKSNNY